MRGLSAQLEIGRMDEVIYFDSNDYAKDSFGGNKFTGAAKPEPVKYRANVEYVRNQEQMSSVPQEKVFTEIRIKMRKVTPLPTYAQNVVWRDEIFEIIGIALGSRQRFLTIQARMVDNISPQ